VDKALTKELGDQSLGEGEAGFIGSHVVDAFQEAGHDIGVVNDFSTGRASNLNSGARFYRLDIRNPGLAGSPSRNVPT
jgi:nucleoside-diphosphate-sugar epimerase